MLLFYVVLTYLHTIFQLSIHKNPMLIVIITYTTHRIPLNFKCVLILILKLSAQYIGKYRFFTGVLIKVKFITVNRFELIILKIF